MEMKLGKKEGRGGKTSLAVTPKRGSGSTAWEGQALLKLCSKRHHREAPGSGVPGPRYIIPSRLNPLSLSSHLETGLITPFG